MCISLLKYTGIAVLFIAAALPLLISHIGGGWTREFTSSAGFAVSAIEGQEGEKVFMRIFRKLHLQLGIETHNQTNNINIVISPRKRTAVSVHLLLGKCRTCYILRTHTTQMHRTY